MLVEALYLDGVWGWSVERFVYQRLWRDVVFVWSQIRKLRQRNDELPRFTALKMPPYAIVHQSNDASRNKDVSQVAVTLA